MAKKIYVHGKFTGKEILTEEEHRQRQLSEREESNRRHDLYVKSRKREIIGYYKSCLKRIESKDPSQLPDNLPDINSLEQLSLFELESHHRSLLAVLRKQRTWNALKKEAWGNLHKTNFVWFFLIVFWPLGLYLLAKRIRDKS